MAADEAREIASLVAAHLQKLGLTKSLSAFLAENGEITSVQNKELDLETIYKFYTSSQANGTGKAEKRKNKKSKDESVEGVIIEPSNVDLKEEVKEDDKPSSKSSKKRDKKRDADVSAIVTDDGQADKGNKEPSKVDFDEEVKADDKTSSKSSKKKAKKKDADDSSAVTDNGQISKVNEEAVKADDKTSSKSLKKNDKKRCAGDSAVVSDEGLDEGNKESSNVDLKEAVKVDYETSTKSSKKKGKKKGADDSAIVAEEGPVKEVNNEVDSMEEVKAEDKTRSKSSKKVEKKRSIDDSAIVTDEGQVSEGNKENTGKEDEVTYGFTKKKGKKQKISKENRHGDTPVILGTKQNEKVSNKMDTVEGEEEEASKLSKEKGNSINGNGNVEVIVETKQIKKPSNKKEKKISAEVDEGKEITVIDEEKAEKKQDQPESDQNGECTPKVEAVNGTTEKKKRSKKEKSNDKNIGNVDETVVDTVVGDVNVSTPHTKAKKNSKANGVHETQQESSTPSNGAVQEDGSVPVKLNGLDSTGTKKRKDTSGKSGLPSGALAFRRVEAEKVEFSDPRLSDNSYWAKDGADEGYGAKAQEILGVVKGRDFRHEKTKKKRGSYRGGLIDLESHSIKFQDSDD